MNYFWRLIKPAFIAPLLPSEGHQSSTAGYPSKPIRFIVPFAPDGPGDMLARVIGKQLTESWGQPVIIDNQHGANGIVGSELATKAAPDGYTIVMAASAHYINPSIYRKLPFDPIKDFAPVSLVASGPNILVVHPSIPADSANELIAFAKSKPGHLKYASGGHGSPSHLAGELFKIMAGVDIVHVPYAGHAAAGVALSEGREAQLMFDAVLTAMPHVKTGKWRALAVTTTQRAPGLPDVPTIAESGLPGYEVSPAIGVLAPRGTPEEIVSRLSKEIAKIVQMPDVKGRLQSDGAEPIGNTPEEFAAYIMAEIGKWAKVVMDTGVPIRETPY
jgi:tripartite-type tricarboxylate transporter receptor subunit TctC